MTASLLVVLSKCTVDTIFCFPYRAELNRMYRKRTWSPALLISSLQLTEPSLVLLVACAACCASRVDSRYQVPRRISRAEEAKEFSCCCNCQSSMP